MAASLSIPLLWGQSFLQGVPEQYRLLMSWLFVFGETNITVPGILGGVITWLKVVSLFCLLGWVVSWLATAAKERTVGRGGVLDFAALAALIGVVGTMLWSVLEGQKKVPVYKIYGVYSLTLMAITCGAILFLWAEVAIWRTIRKAGRAGDVVELLGLHLALALGLGFGVAIHAASKSIATTNAISPMSMTDALGYGLRMSGTYMGYVVLAHISISIIAELIATRPRRLYAIAKLTWYESNRRMWAPWVVITLFLVVLAFTHWFLTPPRPAEMGRVYVGTLSLLCTALLTLMVTFLTPLSLPQDIQNQTIYTVVTKPVRRIELIWGRMLGYMTLVTLLIVFYGVVSLWYLSRTVGGTITATETAAKKAMQQNKLPEARVLNEQAVQLRTRMAARVPVFGSLTFLDSRGTPHLRGIDVGQEQSLSQPRSHVEGATPATAIWNFGVVPDPFTPPGSRPQLLDRRVPVSTLIREDSVEGLLNKSYEAKNRIAQAEKAQEAGSLPANRLKELAGTLSRSNEELKTSTEAYEKLKAQADAIVAKAVEAEKEGKATDGQTLRRQAAALHAAPIPLEMTFNVYRTTKGRVGEPVYAEIEATNPVTGAQYRNIFPIREYYTNKQLLPASVLAGGQGNLKIEVRCISPTQYLGMAENDLFLLSKSGDFGTNFMKGLVGVWLQAMVLTAIGVFAGTFLSWPVALLATLAFFVAGQLAFTALLEFTRQSFLGGGPFESLIRLISHENQMSDLTPTASVVVAKTLDGLVMPIMSRLVYIVPNFTALDVSTTVANGFAVSWYDLLVNTLLALAYALPFSIAGYFILKNREVAA